jgi:hypothetical protein
LAIIGRALIEKSRLDKLSTIEAKRQEALASLNIKYASADKVKTSFGYIGVISLSAIWFGIILNDLAKLLNCCYEETIELLEERRQRKEKERKYVNQVIIQIEEKNVDHNLDLEEKLEEIHFQLVKACAARKT